MAAAAHRAEPNTVRHHKTIVPAESARSTKYPSIIAVQGKDPWDEAARLAELISFLKDQGTIRDYEQVALLLHTVRLEKVGPYVHALKQAGISVFVHGSRDFFYRREVRDIIACFGVIFDRQAGDDDEIDDADYLQDTIEDLKERTQHHDILAQTVRAWRDQITQLPSDTPEHAAEDWVEDLFHAVGAPNYTIIDYFYHLMATPPCTTSPLCPAYSTRSNGSTGTVPSTITTSNSCARTFSTHSSPYYSARGSMSGTTPNGAPQRGTCRS